MDNLDQRAIDILERNDRGGYSVPTAHLYPYQWNWDSAFAALGFATFDRDRAWRELELLIEGQWDKGMIPHILFRTDDPDYFPGPSVWQAGNAKIATGGISQPPVLASVIRLLVESGGQSDDERARALFDHVLDWHRWYHRDRKPDACPVIAAVHPWETGRDNSPDWDLGLSQFEPSKSLPDFDRKDTAHVDPSMRPSDYQYAQYLTIIEAGRAFDWDQKRLTEEGPFLVADPGNHFILLRADRDLLALALGWGTEGAVAELTSWIEAAELGSAYLWNDKQCAYCARDVRTGKFSNGFSNASALCLYAGVGDARQRAGTVDNMMRIQRLTNALQPSWDPAHAQFEPQRYWRGPVWPQMNYMIAKGLEEQGFAQLALRLREDMERLIRTSGFWECFNPETGEGCIGSDFSWTAAIWLAWASPDTTALAA